MKKFICFSIALATFSNFSLGQSEQKIETTIKEVTVYLQGAQIKREEVIKFQSGKTTLKFTNLSPYIEEKSIQLKAAGDFTILSVNRHLNYLNEVKRKDQEEDSWNVKIKALEKDLKIQETKMFVLQEEIKFLKQNINIKGDNTLSVNQLKEAANFYRERLSGIKQEELNTQSKINSLSSEISQINRTISNLYNDNELPNGEVWVNIDAKTAGSSAFELYYLVNNASWFPSYDVRVNSISEPVNLIYKANVQQKTEQDWKNVKISFSTSDPKKSAVAPELKPYYLNYNLSPPNYDNNKIGSVSGVVTDSNGEPLPGVNVLVKNSTVGTVSDINGRYSLTLPNNASTLVYSYVGYATNEVEINGPTMNISLIEDVQQLNEVVVIGYGEKRKRNISGSIRDNESDRMKKEIKVRGLSTLPVATEERETATNIEFSVSNPYTIPSDGKNLTIEMQHYEVPANYEYYAVPKITPDAFLLAYVPDWEKYNLLAGEAQIYFENTFMGKSILDVSNVGDTLQLSLGVDKGLVINRMQKTNYTSSQFLSSKKEEARSWLIKIKNNKNQIINLRLLDQVPVSEFQEIEVDVEEKSNGKINVTNGEVVWNLNMAPGEQKEIKLHYQVKYPKYRNLRIE